METQQDMIRKRGRGEELVESGTSPLHIPGKKEETTLSLSNFEVGASSLNWAQLHR